MDRFAGAIAPLCDLDVSYLVLWVNSIPGDMWPKTAGHMVHEEFCRAYKSMAGPLREIMKHFPECVEKQHYLSMIRPGQYLGAHIDPQEDTWRVRVHVPLITNPDAVINIDDTNYHLVVGTAYKVNTLKKHIIRNDGHTPRVHWMFDVHVAIA